MHLHKLALFSVGTFVPLYLLFWLACPPTYLFWFSQLCVLTTLSVVAWSFAHFLYDLFNTEKVLPSNKAVLITGCDTGFGHQLAKKLDSYGFHVFAGVLVPEGKGANDLREECSKRMHVLKMDVTRPEDVESVVKDIKKSKLSLWAVVNNAGIAIGCPFDWGKDVDVYRKTFEVNVFGLVRVTKNLIPLLRKSKGRVINIASVAGRLTVPIMGHYCMAKHSVRVFSDVLRRELYQDQVSIITIEPTFYQTPIVNFEQINQTRERIFAETPDDIREAYSEQSIKSLLNMEKLVNVITRSNVNEVVSTLERAVTLVSPKPFYRCCGYHEVAVWAASHMPETILDLIVSGVINNKYSVQLAKRYISLFKGKQKSS